MVHTRYYDLPVDDKLLTEGAIDGMLSALGDDHTRYLSPKDEEAARQSMSGEFQGIGAEVEGRDGFITVVSPIEGSPAEAAGLQPGTRHYPYGPEKRARQRPGQKFGLHLPL